MSIDKELLLQQEPSFLTGAKKKGWVCPYCGNGSGSSGDGITSKDKSHYHCFKCGSHSDVIELYMAKENITDFNQACTELAKYYGITADTPLPKKKPVEEVNPTPIDRTEYILQVSKNIERTDYHRGISLDTLNRYKIGYDPQWRVNPKAPYSPRLIIPTSKYSYIARDTRTNLNEEEKRYSKMKIGRVHIFNSKALRTADIPFFVVEGEIDALSIIDCGYEAIGLGSTSNLNLLAEVLKQDRPSKPLLLALDNDEAGKKATEKLAAVLDEMGIEHYQVDIYGAYKDANDFYMADPQGFKDSLDNAIQVIENSKAETKADYTDNSNAGYLQSFLDGINNSRYTQDCVSTGFKELDNVLDGGLYPGLIFIGAISSLGKTTLSLQIMDNIAAWGNDVLIFSLEMSRTELIAKSVSRHTAIYCLAYDKELSYAKTTRGVLTGKRYENYSQEEKQIIASAVSGYESYANHVYVVEGMGNVGTSMIRNMVEQHISMTGRKPVVLIDYLQMISSAEPRMSEKQHIDNCCLELKRLSRDFNIPVVAISSLNRQSYNDKINMSAFKESGAIEYSSDVLIGLQFEGAGESDFDVNNAKQSNPRSIELVILKNRNGQTGQSVLFDYFPMFNYFVEIEEI